MASLRVLLLAAAGLRVADAVAGQVSGTSLMNPIRKVVTLLQTMQQKVVEEGEAEKALFVKFMCYCKTGVGDLSASVAEANTKTPALQSEIEASEGRLTQSKADLTSAQVDRAAANTAMEEATVLRGKEAASFAASKSEMDVNIAAVTKAVVALKKGMGGSFLQTQAAQVLRKLLTDSKVDMADADRQDITAFLEQKSQYAPQSGAITGILEALGDEMSKDLSDMVATEEAAMKNYEGIMSAKKQEVEANSATVEAKTSQIGELGVAIVMLKEDLTDTEAQLVENQKFLAELGQSCSTKEAEWDERQKTRAEELVAIADTIKVLNDDDALDLFKKTIPSAASSLLQLRSSKEAQRSRALSAIRALRQSAPTAHRPQLDLLALALTGRRALSQSGFEQVIKLCDDMVVMLKTEQVDDDNKKEYCSTQFDLADDKKKALERSVSDEVLAIADAKEGVATLTQEIAELEASIKGLDKSVAEATEQRKAEHEEYKELLASDSAAKELLAFAKNRLNKFYNPNSYKAPAKQELSAEDRIAVNNGGTPPPTEAPGGIAGTGISFVQISKHRQLDAASQAPPPPPATWDAYSTKSEGSNSAVAMIDLLITDLEKELTEAEVEEKNAQESYQAMMSDSADKRAQDAKSLTEKGSAKAQLDTDIQTHEDSHKGAVDELMATEMYIHSLHGECDFMMKYFEVRQTARKEEIDSLNMAKAVLSGADISLVQTRGFLSRRA